MTTDGSTKPAAGYYKGTLTSRSPLRKSGSGLGGAMALRRRNNSDHIASCVPVKHWGSTLWMQRNRQRKECSMTDLDQLASGNKEPRSSGPSNGQPVIRHVLACVDGSSFSQTALAHASAISGTRFRSHRRQDADREAGASTQRPRSPARVRQGASSPFAGRCANTRARIWLHHQQSHSSWANGSAWNPLRSKL